MLPMLFLPLSDSAIKKNPFTFERLEGQHIDGVYVQSLTGAFAPVGSLLFSALSFSSSS